MNLRRDTLAAAARAISLVESEAGTTVGTVGQLEPRPGGINIGDMDEIGRDQV